MLSLRLYGKGDIRLEETDIPRIAENEILIKTKAAAICGTDVRMWASGVKNVCNGRPLTLGHEFSGEIVGVGRNVRFYKIGMRVGMQPNIGCGLCDRCATGNSHLCDGYKAFGINIDGAFAEYVRVPGDGVAHGNLTVLPEGISDEEASLCEPLSCAYNGFGKCFVKPGEKALVVGAGPIGAMHAKLLNMAGAIVMMNDISKERLDVCKGIMPFIKTYHGDGLEAFVSEQTGGRGLDIAIAACPVPSVQAALPSLMNYGGRINFFGGVPEEMQPVAIDTNLVHYRELYLTGSTRSSIIQFRKAVELVADDLIGLEDLITHKYRLNEANEAFDNAKQAKGLKHVIIF